jgi:predicted O-methyltransferase YrrM
MGFPGPKRIARRLQYEWERHKPIAQPLYIPNTPRIEGRMPLDIYFPPSATTLGAAALAPETREFVTGVLKKLAPTEEIENQVFFYGWGQGKFGTHWRFADITTVLASAAIFLRPVSYLEIGVRRGRSASVVAATNPQCAIYGFDLWVEGYAGKENPGPDFVREELQRVGHTGEVTLVSGDSRHTVPEFLAARPDLFFELITVDGDHSVTGAAADLANTLPRLKVGGVLVFDDVRSAPLLLDLWERIVKRDRRFVTWEFVDAGTGIAAAVRVSDARPVAMMS